jgi:hypothetical protein
MELTAIVSGLLLAVGGAVVLTGLVVHDWVAGHPVCRARTRTRA